MITDNNFPTFVHKLQNNNSRKLAAIADAYNVVIDLETYLLSPKFHNDPTVQVQDILNYMEKMRSILLQSLD
jgi:hypothetical protein